MAEKVETVVELDRLSSLPDDILCHILSFLSTKKAVQTSILSPRWRYLFASMSTFDFVIGDQILSNLESFSSFVDRLFFFPNQVRFERFILHDYSDKDISATVYGWLCAVLWRGVKEIDIFIDIPLAFPTFLFTCESLVTLKLEMNEYVEVPSKVCLPNLKTLHLLFVILDDDDSLHRLILRSPALEDFVLDICGGAHLQVRLCHVVEIFGQKYYVVEIIAPNLVMFKYASMIAEGYTLSGMKSLEKAHIGLEEFEFEPDGGTYNSETERGATHLLQAICNVQYLKLAIGNAEKLFGNRLESVLVFSNLVELEFESFHEEDVTWLVKFLQCVPVLNKLKMNVNGGLGSRPDKVPSCLTSHLKEMEIRYFSGTETMFEMVGYFLNHASVLEKLRISTTYGPKKQTMIEEILSLPKNSKKCEVVAY